MSEITQEEVDAKYIKGFVVSTGPSHAEEVIQQMLTVVTAASDDMEIAKKVQEIFSNQTYLE